ncbi:GDYXXLXY domain-containing protein [Magnetococcus sp. PR-3]|uniref:GDYXXLXY domain-containing protein n=1 Tax=Magnetococcus sp. PR-3 TaxID=3120355 RepID=UPI002FCE372F
MRYPKFWTILAVSLPILALSGLVGVKSHILQNGQTIILPITGLDPRDLLSGHYLTYQVHYGVQGLCSDQPQVNAPSPLTQKTHRSPHGSGPTSAFLCLDPKQFFYNKPAKKTCQTVLAGRCHNGQFTAGIEKFYIPQKFAPLLERAVQNQQGQVSIKVTADGKAQVDNLFIQKQPWKSYLNRHHPTQKNP